METYNATMSRVPVPKKGCFKSSYPSTTWVEVPCGTPPERPYPQASGRQPEIVGNGNDFSAQVTSGTISQATGSFDSITGLTSESDGGNNNSYSLQLNTNASLNPTLCQGAKTPSQCSGWQQFVYSSSGYAFIQYWLLNYGNACPSGWNTYYSDCWRNGTNGAPVSAHPITNLAQLRLTGTADAGGTDTVIMSTPNGDANAANQDSLLDLAKGWNAAEFNVFGDCCGSQANFNGGVTMVVRTSVDNGTKNAPTCTATGYTGETNNLTLVPPCSTVGGASPAIVFKESDPPASIWVYTGTPCSGSSCPGWQLLDDNNESVRIAAGDNGLYQLHNTGKIWHYTGTPCSGGACPRVADAGRQPRRTANRDGRKQPLRTAQHWEDLALYGHTLQRQQLPRLAAAGWQCCNGRDRRGGQQPLSAPQGWRDLALHRHAVQLHDLPGLATARQQPGRTGHRRQLMGNLYELHNTGQDLALHGELRAVAIRARGGRCSTIIRRL